MENNNFLNELIGEKVLVKTHFGAGTKDDMVVGDYKGIILAFDGNFIKIEYEVKKFVEGANQLSKSVLLLNIADVITIERYQEKPERF